MNRPRPHVEGKARESVRARDIKSKAPESARVVPKSMTKGAAEAKRRLEMATRSKAAHRLLSTTGELYRKNNESALDPCTGQDTGEEVE